MALKFDPVTEDLILDGDSLNIVLDDDATVQYVRAKLKTIRGEWFLDESVGIPYFEEIFKKSFDPAIVDDAFKTAILSTPGIVELLEYTLALDSTTRELTVTFTARTPEGTIISFNEVVP